MNSSLAKPLVAFIMLLPLWFAAGCASDSGMIASIAEGLPEGETTASNKAYARQLAALMAQDGLRRFDLENGFGARRRPQDVPSGHVTRKRRKLADLAAPLTGGKRIPGEGMQPGSTKFAGPWRRSSQMLYLSPTGKQSGSKPFAFSGLQAKSVEIRVVASRDQAFRLTLLCDGAMDVQGPDGATSHPAGAAFTIAARARKGRDEGVVALHPGPDLNRCDGKAMFSHGDRSLTLLREEWAQPGLAALDSRFDICSVPAARAQTALETAFYADRWLSQSCPFELGETRLLDDERDAFNARVKALLGTVLPARFYDEGDPELPLDFSRAPRLHLVVVSYLDIKADFSGRVLDRLLRYHAGRGATIRIIASDILVREKDRAMLEALASDHLNVQFKTFSWIPPRGATPGERLSRLYKVHHTKLLAAISTEPGRSVAILGGRNIHDGFLFDKPLDLSAYPSLQQYGRSRGLTLDYYSNWRDLDIALYDDDAVGALAAHFSTMWFDDARTHVARAFSIAVKSDGKPRHGVARHFISVPYADGHALEAYYADLIDASRRSIEIVNPYLNLTPLLGAAIERAVGRGVAISIVGRIDLRGDLGGDVVTALNQHFVSQYADRIAIYDYKDTKILLHAKILLIDGCLVSVSSVNFNNRSFIHDNENGIAALDEDLYGRVKAVFETYRAVAQPVEPRAVPLAWRLLFTSKLVREAL